MRTFAVLALFAGLFAGLSACSSGFSGTGGLFDSGSDAPAGGLPAAGPPIDGNGVKIALLLPLSASGQAGAIARALKEAGELALFDTPNPGIVLVPKDTRGTPDGARLAATQAMQEGAELLIGPLFAGSVRAVAPVARQNGKSVIAFSTDRTVAGDGIYLLSFLPEQDVDRVVAHAIKSNKKNFAALIPKSAYGTLVENALANSLAERGGKLVAVEHYVRSEQGLVEPVRKIATAIKDRKTRIDALLVPESGQILRSFAAQFAAQGIRRNDVQLVGTGLWDDSAIGADPVLAGGWFAAPPVQSKAEFAERFEKTYSRKPPRIASLAYDAVSLAIALSRGPQGERFSAAQLTNAEGFAGVDGLFRFTANGLNQRGLAVMAIAPNEPRIVAAPPNRFGSGAGF